MEINELVKEVHKGLKEKGFADGSRTIVEQLALINCEVAEAVEEIRSGKAPNETYYSCKESSSYMGEIIETKIYNSIFKGDAPTKNLICNKIEGVPSELADIILRVCGMCGEFNIDIETIIKEKMEYNKTRVFKHGKTM